jgi:hypothetical protein
MSSENQNPYLEIIKDAEASNRGVMRGHFDVRKISTKVGMHVDRFRDTCVFPFRNYVKNIIVALFYFYITQGNISTRLAFFGVVSGSPLPTGPISGSVPATSSPRTISNAHSAPLLIWWT